MQIISENDTRQVSGGSEFTELCGQIGGWTGSILVSPVAAIAFFIGANSRRANCEIAEICNLIFAVGWSLGKGSGVLVGTGIEAITG